MSDWDDLNDLNDPNDVDDEQDVAEGLDDEELSGEYPPDQPLGAADEGVTGLEQLGGESVSEREDRTEPEVWERDSAPASETGPQLEGEAEPGTVDEEKDLVAPPFPEQDPGPLEDDDDFTGDETTRDVAPERSPDAAEDAAVRIDDEAPGAVG
jgi:hypothetical protein